MPASSPSFKQLPLIVHLLLPLLLLQLVSHAQTISRGQLYSQQSVCQGKVLSSDHRKQTQSVRSLIQCLSVCQATEGCVAVVHEPDSGLCHLGDSFAWGNCSNMEPVGAVRMTQYEVDSGVAGEISCENGGRMENGGCVCTQPYHGHRCEKILRDCNDTVPYAHDNLKHVTMIYPTSSPSPFPVNCLPDNGRTYVFRNFNGQETFNRSWQEYVDGFGEVDKDYWLGLEHLHHLTHNARQYSLIFVMFLANNSKMYYLYDNFQISGSADGYTFSTSGYTTNRQTEDCLGPLIGAPFSTYDNDSDGSAGVNCAQRHGFGWWFRGENCSSLCLPFGKRNDVNFWWSGDASDAFWATEFGSVSIGKIYGYFTTN